MNDNNYDEWFFQSDYDLDTAEDMLKSGRHVYCIFMCHLSIEKALKGLYFKKTNEFPPKTHSLVYLLEKLELQPIPHSYEFIFTLNKISVPTRYPDDLRNLFKTFTKEKTETILNQSKQLQLWIKQQ